MVLAAGGTDRAVRVWDCRMINPSGVGDPGQETTKIGGVCETELLGHEYAVRKVQWSPHRADLLASASYDMTCRMCVLFSLHASSACHRSADEMNSFPSPFFSSFFSWSTSPPPGRQPLLYIEDGHTEFVVGCAWSLYDEGLLASCGWDSKVNLCRP